MNTPAHVLLNLSLLKPKNRDVFWPVLAGAMAPDFTMFLFYLYQKINRTPESTIWNERYFDPAWQTFFDVFNSLPLLVLLGAVSYLLKVYRVLAFFLSMTVHVFFDFWTHNDDGHAHFWPLSDYKFASPVSYWDPDHYGIYFVSFEILLSMGCFFYLWKVYASKTRRAALIIALIPYILMMGLFLVYFS